MAAVLLGYVALEIVFNLYLVETMAAPRVEEEEITRLARFGKLLASFGLVLFVFRPFLGRLWRRLRVGVLALFAVAWFGAYAGIVELFDYVIEQVPRETQVNALQLVSYRDGVFSGMIESRSLLPPDGRIGIDSKLALVNLPLHLTSSRRAARIVEQVDEMRRRQTLDTFEAAFSQEVENGWSAYTAQPGPEPAPTDDSMAAESLGSNEAPPVAIGSILPCLPVESDAGTASASLDRAAYQAMFRHAVEPCRQAAASNLPPLEQGVDLKRVTEAVFLPPMSMTLSLIAMIVNLGAMLGLLLSHAAPTRLGVRVVANLIPASLVALLLMASVESPFVEGSLNDRLHQSLSQRLGPVGWIWARAINGEAIVLKISSDFGA